MSNTTQSYAVACVFDLEGFTDSIKRRRILFSGFDDASIARDWAKKFNAFWAEFIRKHLRDKGVDLWLVQPAQACETTEDIKGTLIIPSNNFNRVLKEIFQKFGAIFPQ